MRSGGANFGSHRSGQRKGGWKRSREGAELKNAGAGRDACRPPAIRAKRSIDGHRSRFCAGARAVLRAGSLSAPPSLCTPTPLYRAAITPKPQRPSGRYDRLPYDSHFAVRYDVDPRMGVSMIIEESESNPNCTLHRRHGSWGSCASTARGPAWNNTLRSRSEPGRLGGLYLRSRLALFATSRCPRGRNEHRAGALAHGRHIMPERRVKK